MTKTMALSATATTAKQAAMDRCIATMTTAARPVVTVKRLMPRRLKSIGSTTATQSRTTSHTTNTLTTDQAMEMWTTVEMDMLTMLMMAGAIPRKPKENSKSAGAMQSCTTSSATTMPTSGQAMMTDQQAMRMIIITAERRMPRPRGVSPVESARSGAVTLRRLENSGSIKASRSYIVTSGASTTTAAIQMIWKRPFSR